MVLQLAPEEMLNAGWEKSIFRQSILNLLTKTNKMVSLRVNSDVVDYVLSREICLDAAGRQQPRTPEQNVSFPPSPLMQTWHCRSCEW